MQQTCHRKYIDEEIDHQTSISTRRKKRQNEKAEEDGSRRKTGADEVKVSSSDVLHEMGWRPTDEANTW